MKKLLATILFLITSTIFVVSLLAISTMQHDMPMKNCAISRLGGSSECFFSVNKGIIAVIKHISSVIQSLLGVVNIDLLTFILIIGLVAVLFVWNFTQKLFLYLFKQLNYFRFIHHNNKAFFPFKPKFLLNWLNQKIRGQIVLVPSMAYNNSC